jgi:putative hydrolase of HD superfamily
MERLTRQLEFVREAGRLRSVLRLTELTDPPRLENSAEHSWHLAVMALALGEHAPEGTDLATVIAMLVLHDLVEIDAGDLSAHAPAAAQARQGIAERAAADRLFAILPANQARGLRRLWDEFEERVSPEARFARALDRLQPMLENVRAGGRAWRAQGVTAGQVLSKVTLIEDGSPALGAFARELIEQAVTDGILAPGPGPEPPPPPRQQQQRKADQRREADQEREPAQAQEQQPETEADARC